MYLSVLLNKYKKTILWILATIPPLAGGIWNFDFQKLLPSMTLTPEDIWQIRMALSLTLPSLYLLLLLILLIYAYSQDIKNTEQSSNQRPDKKEAEQLEIDDKIILAIAKCRALDIKPTPVKIAEDIGEPPEVILAHMMKLHDQKLMTFYSTDGNPTHIKTPFFLSPKAMEHIDITIKEKIT